MPFNPICTVVTQIWVLGRFWGLGCGSSAGPGLLVGTWPRPDATPGSSSLMIETDGERMSQQLLRAIFFICV